VVPGHFLLVSEKRDMKVMVVSDMRIGLRGGAIVSEAPLTGAMKGLVSDRRWTELTLVGRPLVAAEQMRCSWVPPREISVLQLPDWHRQQAFGRIPLILARLSRSTRETDRIVAFMPTVAGTVAVLVSRGLRRARVTAVFRGSATETLRMLPAYERSFSYRRAVDLFGWLSRRIASAADDVLFVSRWVASEAGRPEARVAPEVDWSELTDAPAASAARGGLVYLGRLEWEKGVDVAVRAALGDPGSRPLPLQVIGDGTMRADLLSDIRRAGAEESVVLLGMMDRPDVLEQLTRARVVVVPSRSEGFGLAALEAVLSGAWVLYAPVGGLEESVGWCTAAVPVQGHDWSSWRAKMADALTWDPPPAPPPADELREQRGWRRLEDVVLAAPYAARSAARPAKPSSAARD
jgi:glycosyltransferase involved in cell wall biosynthesis